MASTIISYVSIEWGLRYKEVRIPSLPDRNFLFQLQHACAHARPALGQKQAGTQMYMFCSLYKCAELCPPHGSCYSWTWLNASLAHSQWMKTSVTIVKLMTFVVFSATVLWSSAVADVSFLDFDCRWSRLRPFWILKLCFTSHVSRLMKLRGICIYFIGDPIDMLASCFKVMLSLSHCLIIE